MSEESEHEVTRLLEAIQAGRCDARDALVKTMYAELHCLADRLMKDERTTHTLQPTAVLNEAMLKVLRPRSLANLTNRVSFVAACATAMRQVLCDHARKRRAQKRGGDARRQPLTEDLVQFDGRLVELLALDEALCDLRQLKARHEEVVTLRYFGGLSIKEIAGHCEVAHKTVELDLRLARAWLRRRLAGDDAGPQTE